MVVAKRWRGMRWTRQCRHVLRRMDERRSSPAEPFGEDGRSRTAKSCGPDARMLASSLWEANASRGRWCQEAPIHQGEHDIGRKTIAQGRPECFR
jgi:hypothetical protein